MKKFLLLMIIVLAFGLRFYKLGEIPRGMQQDESSLAYNAYSILKTGKDEHGVYMPQFFKAFGEYKLPGYIYASVLPIALFGYSTFSVRFVSALCGILSVILAYAIASLLFEKKETNIPLATTLLLAINPWHIHFSRAAYEVMLASFFILLGVWLFLAAIKSMRFSLLILSVIPLALSLYTYNIARAFTPVLGIIFLVLFWKKIKKFSKVSLIILLLATISLTLPYIYGIFSSGGAESTAGTVIFSSAIVQAPLQELRSYFIFLPGPLNKILFNYWTLTAWQYINNFVAHFSPSFYFINGREHGNSTIGTNGQWYIFELPLIIAGIIVLWKQKNILATKLLLLWIIGLVTVSSFTRDPPQATRTFFLMFPVTLYSGIGLTALLNTLKKIPHSSLRLGASVGCLAIFLWYVTFYLLSYYIRFPNYYAKHWRTGDLDVSIYLRDHQQEYKTIIIDSESGFMYTSLLAQLPFPPNEFQSTAIWSTEDSEGFTHPIRFGKYEFRKINWYDDVINQTLVITTADRKPANIPSFQTFNYPERPVVINSGQEIFRYPITEPAFVLITGESK